MLRAVALGLSLVLLACGLVALVCLGTPAFPFVLFPALMVIGLLCERYLYKPIQTASPGPGWERTAERFVDPQSGRAVAVYFNRQTGERRYVADTEPGRSA